MNIADIVIIDIQFVIGNDKDYFIKELAILNFESPVAENYIFKSKFHYSKLNSQARFQDFYNYRNVNGLRWKDGTLKYEKLFGILQKLTDKVLIVKGAEKKQTLHSFLPTTKIIDLEMYKNLESCSTNSEIYCNLHKQRLKLRCAFNNVFKIKEYMINHTNLRTFFE